jgi:hypothetical protein
VVDATGQAHTPEIPPGRYYLFGMAAYQGKALAWNLPVDLAPGANAVTLSPQNGRLLR